MIVLDGVGFIHGENIEEMDDDACAFDVFEEVVAEPRAGGGALDEAGDIREDESAVVIEFRDTELRLQGGKGEISNGWSCFGDGAEEGGFAGIGEAD